MGMTQETKTLSFLRNQGLAIWANNLFLTASLLRTAIDRLGGFFKSGIF